MTRSADFSRHAFVIGAVALTMGVGKAAKPIDAPRAHAFVMSASYRANDAAMRARGLGLI